MQGALTATGVVTGGSFSGATRTIIGPWGKTDIPASQNNALITQNNSYAQPCQTMARAGSVTAISARCSTAAAGSSVVFEVSDGPVWDDALTIAIAASTGSSTAAVGTYAYAANAVICVRETTTVDWTATTVDCDVWVEVTQ